MTDTAKELATHHGAMTLIDCACTVTTLSYEEAIAIYLRARGILADGAEMLGAPIPSGWVPPSAAMSASQ